MLNTWIENLRSVLYIAPVMLLAVVCHECAHGWVSYRLGDPTAKNAGRLTLNPLKHLDPIGVICMLLFHFGWAKPVPIDPRYYKDPKKGIILVSLAGPAVNLLLTAISVLLAGVIVKFAPSERFVFQILYDLCYYSAMLNIGLCLFNLIPIPPLDGSNVLGAVSGKARSFFQKYQKYCQIALLICIVTGILSYPLGKLSRWIVQAIWDPVVRILHIA